MAGIAVRELAMRREREGKLSYLRGAGEQIIDALVLGIEGRSVESRQGGVEMAGAITDLLIAYDRLGGGSTGVTALAKGMRVGFGEAGFLVSTEYDLRDYQGDDGRRLEGARRIISGLASYLVTNTVVVSGSVLNALSGLAEDESEYVSAIVDGMKYCLKARSIVSR